MSSVVLSEKLLASLAGWEVLKQARAIVGEGRVLSASWEPPMLRGVVQSGTTSYRAGLVIRRENDAENVCTCRPSREWGTICAHSVAIGLQALKPPSPIPAPDRGPSRAAPSSASSPAASAPAARTTTRPILRASPTDDAETLEIHVVLPPYLVDGLAKGRATVFLEGRSGRTTVPLASLAQTRPFHLGPEDGRLLDAAEALALGDAPSMLQLGPVDFAMLLAALVDHPRVTFGKSRRVTIDEQPWRPPLLARLQPDGAIRLQPKPLPTPPAIVSGERFWVIAGDAIHPLDLPRDLLPVLQGNLLIPRSGVPTFVGTALPTLERVAELDADFVGTDFKLEPQAPRFALNLAGGLASLTAQLHCRYGPRILTLGVASKDEAIWMPDPQDPRRYSTRDLAAEKEALARLRGAGFSEPDAQGRLQLNGQNRVLAFFARDHSRLEREWDVTLEERLDRSTRQHLERIEPRFAVTSSGEQWFDLQVSYSSGAGTRLSTEEVQRLLRGGQTHTRLPNGKFALLDTGAVEELEEILVDTAPRQHAGGYRIDHTQAGFVAATLREHGWEPVAPAAWRERALLQNGDANLECPPLGALDAILRPYQKQGVAWLAFLRRNGFGGVLADEMGLGKTLQALAHLNLTRNTERGTRNPEHGTQIGAGALSLNAPPAPHLVICPTSLVQNWKAEAQKFTPGIRVTTLHGPDRESRFADIPHSDLVVTSYALIRRDLDRYRGIEFDTVILDEAQHIKNRQTRNAQAVKAVRSRHRLVLTGTPLENSVLDLWSIFDFLMPGYLGEAADFRDRYEVPVVRERSEAAQARLARRVRPFLLRRLKRDVAPELPPRIDQIVWCELTEAQAAVYGELLEATRRKVHDAVGAQGLPRSRMLVLTALLRLRQTCCDIRLLKLADEGNDPEPETSQAEPPALTSPAPSHLSPFTGSEGPTSGKLEAFSELLQEVIDGGHRVLVFSQFTRLLGLIKEQLTTEDVRFCYLDGSTRDRAGEVARFQNSSDIPVFLISLKAGGVGLNLTAADTVVHLDPWWNPAVEDQASDRAHRIGQTRVVTNYKLITRGTVEEKIVRLQERKREITQGLLTGDEPFATALGWDEIQELLS